ncbi:MAG: coproporphyrinogen dehydrogenase HemZ [Lachnospiraceae bacterium]|nr:coproporphyrinogen dehydrogenase HemZ [Lachnospiraceae bacterium]
MIAFWFPGDGEEFEYDVRGLLGAFFPGETQVKLDNRPEILPEDCVFYAVPSPDRTLPYEDIKNAWKRRIYDELSSLTGRKLPWGTLTGIRPVKLVMQKLEAGERPAQIAEEMRRSYYLDGEKLSLAIATAQKERSVLARTHGVQGYSLYIGIPFCPTRCAYCSFTSYPLAVCRDQVDPYLDTLIYELEQCRPLFGSRPLDTVYIGGGTPTSLTPAQSDRLLSAVCRIFPTDDLLEFTVEAGRPDSIDREKLAVFKQYPVSRLSVNPQTMQQKTLDRIGRLHTVEDFRKAYDLARSMGFDNINMDLILGLPGETAADVEDTLRQLKPLQPDDLTVHALAIKRTSRLKMEAEGPVKAEVGEEESRAMMRAAAEGARDMGLFPYYLYRQKNMAGNLENVGYAAPGKEGIYNILIMEEKQSILAAGAGNISKAVYSDGRIERADNVKQLRDYRDRIEEMIERKRRLWL